MTRPELVNVVDIFCGAGGLSTGFSKAGYNIITGVDNYEHSLSTFAENHNCQPVLADVQDEDAIQCLRDSVQQNGYSFHDVDLVMGGPPCKGFSMANSQSNGHGHPLNQLPERFLEIVGEIDPAAVLIENVPRMLTIEDGAYKEAIVSRLQRSGYKVSFGILDAGDFGVPQNRRRVFFIGHKEKNVELPSPGSIGFNFSTPVTVGEAISDLPELPTGGGGQMEMEYSIDQNQLSEYAKFMRIGADPTRIFNHRTTKNMETTYRRFKHIPQGGNWRDIPEKLMENYSNRNRTHDHIYQRLTIDEPAKTVANFRKQMIVHPTQNRLLSVREAARLQSFPDDYHFGGGSFNARQQMVGDAVPVNLAYALAKNLATSFSLNNQPQAQ